MSIYSFWSIFEVLSQAMTLKWSFRNDISEDSFLMKSGKTPSFGM